jgi:signal transduction histidine kinase
MNAFRHAQARLIELELEYGLKQLRILIRDDGQGVDPKLLRSGREGHWGIAGMRERAEVIGAKLRLWSRPGAGTEVELSVPAKIAYESKSTPRSKNWLTKFLPRAAEQDSKKEV